MGWTSYIASCYRNGKVDRKAECDAYFLGGERSQHYRVLKSVMRGSEYYAAVQTLMEPVDANKYGQKSWRLVTNGPIWAAVFLTKVKGDIFSYKDMDETEGPCYWKCPKSVLKLLTDTDNTNAKEWRDTCRRVNGYK